MENINYIVCVLIFLAALLYASIGHGGASGYLAVMAIMGIAPTEMRPAALVLNILVSAIATYRFARMGAFSWSLFWPLAIVSVPFAYLGGRLNLPLPLFKLILGVVLLYCAAMIIISMFKNPAQNNVVSKPNAMPNKAILGLSGAGLGLLSGLTGVGGGIFLSPLMLVLRWAEVRTISGVAAAFIFVNSIAGLLGRANTPLVFAHDLPYWAISAVLGGALGASLGSQYFNAKGLKFGLALVLLIAAIKMILTA